MTTINPAAIVAPPTPAFDSLGDPTGWDGQGGMAGAVHLASWSAANKHLMVPPVGNKYLYSGQDFFVMLIAGPNARNDFHLTDSEEFFYQLKGDVSVRVRDAHGVRDIPLREGECLFIPAGVPHRPQRGPGTLGMVVERRRPASETEHMIFYCDKCDELVYDKEFACKDIVTHFRQAMEAFWADPKLSTCSHCGTRVPKPGPRTG
ncbi:MAG: 3-hydroxyanthranilate 3,4-dioxygenase [Phycisphaerales bacterium]|nr:3-hydroxyanthranilate 3,4-dioxygenase [Phycisphaerales bacterium]